MSGKSPVPRSFSHAQATARQRRVIELLAAGTKARDIAKTMGGITENGARKLMARALKAQAAVLLSDGAFEAAAAVYLERHDMLLEAWLPHALGVNPDAPNERGKPDKDAADVVLRLMKLFADVYGLNAPIRVQPVDPDSGPGRPGVDLVTAVMAHLDELSERMGIMATPATPIVIEHDLPQVPDIAEVTR
jgi:hypothetical protein